MKVRVGAAALLLTLSAIDQAMAGFFRIVPNTPPPPPPPPVPVPEIDGSGSIAAIALLASIAAILVNKYRSR